MLPSFVLFKIVHMFTVREINISSLFAPQFIDPLIAFYFYILYVCLYVCMCEWERVCCQDAESEILCCCEVRFLKGSHQKTDTDGF